MSARNLFNYINLNRQYIQACDLWRWYQIYNMSQQVLRDHSLLFAQQELFESMQLLTSQFFTLRSMFPDAHFKNKEHQSFFETTLLFRDPDHKQQNPIAVDDTFQDILNQNISELLTSKSYNYVQCYGHQIRENTLSVKHLSLSRTVLNESPLSKLHYILGKQLLVDIIYNYTVIVRHKGQYFQVLGIPLHQKFGFKVIGEKRKQKKRDKTDYSSCIINRFTIYYCSHAGREPGIFRKNVLFRTGIKCSNNQTQEVQEIVTRQLKKMFPSDNPQCGILSTEKQAFQNIFERMIRNYRSIFQFRFAKDGRRTSQFNGLITQFCRLPPNYTSFKETVDKYQQLSSKQVQALFNQFYSHATEYSQVKKLLEVLVERGVPNDLLGHNNKIAFISLLKEFVIMKRFENFKIEDILRRMDILEPQWLLKQFSIKYKRPIITRKRKVFAEIICWIYNNVIIPVIKYNFYVTEKHKEANKIFYFRKPLWVLISKLATRRFSESNIKQLSKKEYLDIQSKNYPEGKLRIMPKKDSFRPIITFNRKIKTKDKYSMNLNQILAETQLVLRNLKDILGKKFGYCIFDNRQIFEKYDQFILNWRQQNCPQLSFFTLDIKKCYDSISPQRLYQFIQNSELIEQAYLITRYLKVYRNKKPLKNKHSMPYYYNVKQRTAAVPLSTDPLLLKQSAVPPSIHIYLPFNKIITRSTILQHLGHLCQKSIITYQNKSWMQVYGIPQGLNVSGVLCSLYFAELQRKYISEINNGLLMRLTDDYVFIGKKDQAQKVIQSLFLCSRENQFEFNQQKIKGNFNHPLIRQIYQQEKFIWIGKQINIRTMQVFPVVETDTKRLAYSMNVNIPKKYLKNFLKNKLKSLLTNHFSSYFKPALFDEHNLHENIRIFCRLSLNKFFPFIQGLFKMRLGQKQEEQLLLKILQPSLHEFIIYACYLYGENKRIHIQVYYSLLHVALDEFVIFFKTKRTFKIGVLRKIEGIFKHRLKTLDQKFGKVKIAL